MGEIAIVGAGTMGAGLAELAARHGDRVHLIDADAAALDRARERIEHGLQRQVDKGRLDAATRQQALHLLRCSARLDGLDAVGLVLEAVPETLELKQGLLAELAQAAPGAVQATNTSSLSIAAIARGLPAPERLVGLHFFNPAPVMPLVELVRGAQSSPEALQTARAVAEGWGKTCVAVQDSPGFVVNRVARGYYLEALRLLDEGVAGVAAIDALLRERAGFKLGPFELMDLIGLDVGLSVGTAIWQGLGRPARLQPHPLQQQLVQQGQLGRKSGRGFYDHRGATPRVAVERPERLLVLTAEQADALLGLVRALGVAVDDARDAYVVGRILGAIFNEAAALAEAGLCSPADIDLAMRLGTNYPQGPLAWAAAAGPATLRAGLAVLQQHTGDARYAPAPSFGGAQPPAPAGERHA